MTNAQLWRRIGSRLAAERHRRGWTRKDIEHRGGPNYVTVDAHERGAIRTIAALDKHLAVVGWTLEGLLRQILQESPPVPSAALLSLATAYQETSDAGRAVWS
jgi:hypothetical protein